MVTIGQRLTIAIPFIDSKSTIPYSSSPLLLQKRRITSMSFSTSLSNRTSLDTCQVSVEHEELAGLIKDNIALTRQTKRRSLRAATSLSATFRSPSLYHFNVCSCRVTHLLLLTPLLVLMAVHIAYNRLDLYSTHNTSLVTESFSPAPLLYIRAAAVCLRPAVNRVLLDDEEHENLDDIRVWSMSVALLAPPVSSTALFCSSLPQLLDAVAFGQRLPVPGFDFTQDHLNLNELQSAILALPQNSSKSTAWGATRKMTEYALSYFVPNGCILRSFSPEQICGIFSQYSDIVIVGDSLTRHTVQGMYMLLSNDAMHGAFPPHTSPSIHGNCTCDGQFSEAKICRDFPYESMSFTDPQSHSICRDNLFEKFALSVRWAGPGQTWWDDLTWICSPDSRPRFIVLQGCLHYKVNATRVVAEFLIPFLNSVYALVLSCPHHLSLRVVWVGVSSPSRSMDFRWPHQSRANQLRYNERVSSWLENFGIRTIDFFNLTLGAATSDGNHYLSEVNALKAQAMINVMQEMAREEHALDITRLPNVSTVVPPLWR